MKAIHSYKFLFALVLIISGTSFLFAKPKTSNAAQPTPTKTVIDTIRIDYSAKKAPIAPYTDTLFYVYGNIGSVTVEQRANAIEENIKTLGEDVLFNPDSMKIGVDGSLYLITYYNKTIMGINDTQADILHKTKEELAQEYLDAIVLAIEKHLDRFSLQNILKEVGLSLLILGITFLCLKYLNRGFRKLKIFIGKQEKHAIEQIKYILDARKQIAIVLFLVRVVRWLCIATILYFCLYAFFSLFPETQWLSDTLIGYIISPLKSAYHSFMNFIPNLFSIIVIVVLFKFFIKAIKVITDRITDGSITFNGFYPDWALPTFNIVKVILYAFMMILIFPHLPGSKSPAFQGVSVFLGILFSLGSTSVIANLMAGLVITYMRPFKLGDRIRVGEFQGNVLEKTPLVTRIKTPKNEVITIPNGVIMSAQTINYTHSASEYGLILYATVTMGYDVPWRKVHELLVEAGLKTPNVLQDPKPFVLQLALDDFYVEYQINIYTKEANAMAPIYSDLYGNIQDVFNREGIELVSPHYRAQRDGSDITAPKEYIRTGFDRVNPFSMKVQITKDEDNK